MDDGLRIIGRCDRLFAGIADADRAAALVMNVINVRYFSGFTGDSSYCLLMDGERYILTDSRYTLQCSQQCPGYRVVDTDGDLLDGAAGLIRQAGIRTLFVEGSVCASDWIRLTELLEGVELRFSDELISKIRIVKDETEQMLSARAAAIATESLESILKYIRPGVSEQKVALELEYEMKKRGASGVSFETIVASGKRSALPHGVASAKLIEAGDPVTVDFGCVFEGYCSDCTRTFFVGQPDPMIRGIYDIVKRAQETALSAIRAGVTGKYVDGIARRIITDCGYGDRFGHGTGHGTGLEIHELPRLSKNKLGDAELQSGMIVTCEPGIYIDGFGGVRIEDQCIVTDTGSKVISTFPKDLMIL